MMKKNRLEAFIDAVIAIIITIMVLELKVPEGSTMADLTSLTHVGFCYILSFIYLAIYWNNHHHLFQAVKEVNGAVLWANIHLLFWLTLFPFVTTWAGETYFASTPTFLYGFILFMAACAYYILTKVLIAEEGSHSLLAQALGKDAKGKLSIVLYAMGMLMAFWFPIGAFCIYLAVAIIWFIPDARIEKKLQAN
jgi:uncharacterized membrane protein